MGPSLDIYTVDAAISINQAYRGTYASMKFDKDNKAVIAYHAFAPSYLASGAVKVARYVVSGGTDCNGGSPEWSCVTVDEKDGAENAEHGSFASLDVSATGMISVGFFNPSKNSLDYAYWYRDEGYPACSNPEWTCVTADEGPGRGKHIAMTTKGNKRRFAYYNEVDEKIYYIEYVGSGGNCTNPLYSCYYVDIVGKGLGHYGISMDVDAQGYPIIAYEHFGEHELEHATLKIARPALAYGEYIGNCGEVLPGNLFQHWTCKTIDNASAWTYEAAFVGVSVSPSGLATVVYSEEDDYAYPAAHYLKVAQQRFNIYLPVISK